MPVYITDLATFLPNQPVSNQQMEEILGMVNQVPSRTRKMILRNNKITTRYYAIDPETGATTHNNAQLTAAAIRKLQPYPDFDVADIECLSCGTSSPDQLMPGHAPMVHGEIGGTPCDVLSASGICTSGMSAFKYAWMSVALGLTKNAVATGSEVASTYMRSGMTGGIDATKAAELESQPVLSFAADFLRWMLSDGAGAAFLSNAPAPTGTSLKVEWVELQSFAHEFEACMYAGAEKRSDGSLRGWREHDQLEEALQDRSFLVKQDVKLLNENIVNVAVKKMLATLVEKFQLTPDQIDWFLPHYSSDYFRPELAAKMADINFSIPEQRWFSNLKKKGNTGSASIYVILAELFHSGRLKSGEKILCFIPESGRFSMCYMLLTVV